MSFSKLEFDSDLSDFLKNSSLELEKNPAVHSFILSLAARYHQSGKQVLHMVRGISESGSLVVAGMQTEPGFPFIISKASAESASLLARSLKNTVSGFPGVNGPSPSADSFASEWSAATGCTSKLISNLRLFELEAVRECIPASGFARLARADDESVIVRWLNEFRIEAVPHDPKQSDEELARQARESTGKGEFFIWEDQGQCVCLLGSTRRTARERWIAPVYTPLHLRGRGYASSLVAAVSQKIVDAGKKGMLFTDLANPTSNSIYQKVGYSPVADFKYFQFS